MVRLSGHRPESADTIPQALDTELWTLNLSIRRPNPSAQGYHLSLFLKLLGSRGNQMQMKQEALWRSA
jgi:hypothetical protein